MISKKPEHIRIFYQSHVIIEENLLINSTKLKTPVINPKEATKHLQWQSWLLYSFLQFIKHPVIPIGGNHDHDYENASLSFDKSEQTLRKLCQRIGFSWPVFSLIPTYFTQWKKKHISMSPYWYSIKHFSANDPLQWYIKACHCK